MSNYGAMPPAGAYTPPTQGAAHPQQQQQTHQPGTTAQGQAGHGSKTGGAFGQIMNQAVTTGKPIFSKLQKTINSKLGGKPMGGAPSHLQNYQNYQQHQGQGQGQGQGQQSQLQGYQHQQHQQHQPPQAQGQLYSPQPQQQQWQQPQQSATSQAPNAYAAQQSPFQQSTYGTPVSAYSGQSNYFPQQAPQPSHAPPPPAQSQDTPGYNTGAYNTPGTTGYHQQPQGQQGQYGYQGQSQGQFQADQKLQSGQYPGQQTGVVGSAPGPVYNHNTPVPHMGDVSPIITPNKPVPQPDWRHAATTPQLPPADSQQQPQGPMSPQPQTHSQTPPQQSAHITMLPFPADQKITSAPSPNNQQQWNATSPISSMPPAPVSPPPPQMQAQLPAAPSMHPPPMKSATPPSQISSTKAPSAPPAFVAELPADLGNLGLAESKSQGDSEYQAYQPAGRQASSPTNRFSVPRRAVSASSLPLADPWRFADAVTEQPTREFYILADLIFDALDRNFEPHNTGLLEAPKILKSWTELTQEAHILFSYDNYTALARMWSLEGVPHIMVPIQPSLTPVWNFIQHSHGQDVKVVMEQPSGYATYMPALNRAGWYKFFFLEAMHGPDDMCKLLAVLCADSYKPGVLNHPDVNRRDRSSIPALETRAAAIQSHAIERVCREAKAAMAQDASL